MGGFGLGAKFEYWPVVWMVILLFNMLPNDHAAFAFTHNDSVPDWVRDAAKEPLPIYPPNTDAVILLLEDTYTVNLDGKAVEHYREVIKILRPQGRDYGVVTVPFNKDSKVNYVHVWSIGPDGHEYDVKDSDIREVGSYDNTALYDDYKAKYSEPPGRDPGGVIAYEYEQKCLPYLNEQNFSIQQAIPIHKQTLTLQLPQDFEYRDVWKGHSEISATSLGNNSWRWELQDIPGINVHDIPMHPSAYALMARMTIHYFGPSIPNATRGDWKTEGELVTRLNSDRIAPTPDITAKALELTAGKTDFYDKAMAIAQYTQKFRYYDIELGIGGLQPHYAEDIYKHQYGDCKDHATILTAMLAAVGIHATAVIVDHRRGVISPDDPSQTGDHEIAAIEIPGGYNSPKLHSVVTTKEGKRFLIFDPTWAYIPFGDIEWNLQGSYGLLADGEHSQVIQIPVLSPEESHVIHKGKFSVQPDGTLTGTVSSSYFGDISENWRHTFIQESKDKQNAAVDKWLGEFFPDFKLNNYSASDVAELNKDMQLQLDFKANAYARKMGQFLLVRPRVVGSIVYPLDTAKRKYPIELGDASMISDDYLIDLPDGYGVDDLPDPVRIDKGFASYESKTEVQGHAVHYTRTFEMRAVELPADKYDDLRHLMEAIGNDERSEVILKKLP